MNNKRIRWIIVEWLKINSKCIVSKTLNFELPSKESFIIENEIIMKEKNVRVHSREDAKIGIMIINEKVDEA